MKVFNLKDRDKSDHYNPFAYIHDTDDIVVVAKNLIKNMKEDPRQKNTADPIWEEGTTSLLEALLAYVYFEQPPEMHNMHRGAASWTIYSKTWLWKSLRHSQRANMDCTTWHRTKPHRALTYPSVCV